MVWIPLILLGAYGAVLTGAFLFQRRLLYQAGTADEGLRGRWEQERIEIPGPDGPVEAWLLHADQLPERPLILYCCGNRDDGVLACEDFHRLGNPCLIWNYPGYGHSAGKPSQNAILKAGMAVRSYILRDLGVPDEQLILFGRSLGSAVATQLAARACPRALILAAPADSIAAVVQQQHPWLPVQALLLDPWRNRRLCRQHDLPLLALVGIDDRIIPNERSNALLRTWPGPLDVRRLHDTSHETMHRHPRYWRSVADFVRRFPTVPVPTSPASGAPAQAQQPDAGRSITPPPPPQVGTRPASRRRGRAARTTRMPEEPRLTA